MADELKTKKITDLEENTTIDDTDILMAGDKGTNALKRFTVAKLFDAIKTKIAGWAFDTLTTTDKTLPGAVNELNSKMSVSGIQSQLEGYSGSCSFSRSGHFVTMHYDLGSDQRPVTDGIKTIFTIPEGYRPSLQYTKYEIYLDNNSYFWRFNPDGTVTIQSMTDVSGQSLWMTGYFTWSI